MDSVKIVELFERGDQTAINSILHYLELLGQSVFTVLMSYLSKDGVVFVGDMINHIFTILNKLENKEVFWDVFLENVFVKNHLEEYMKSSSITYYIGEKEPGL